MTSDCCSKSNKFLIQCFWLQLLILVDYRSKATPSPIPFWTLMYEIQKYSFANGESRYPHLLCGWVCAQRMTSCTRQWYRSNGAKESERRLMTTGTCGQTVCVCVCVCVFMNTWNCRAVRNILMDGLKWPTPIESEQSKLCCVFSWTRAPNICSGWG